MKEQKNKTLTCCICCRSVKRSNCYMVWGGDMTPAAHSASRSNVDLEVGCLIDLATGLLTFTVNGKDIATSYQVLHTCLRAAVAPLYPSALHLSSNPPLAQNIEHRHCDTFDL